MQKLKLKLFLITVLANVTVVNAQQDSVIDDVGDIAFVALSTSSQDGYAFVLLDDCPDGTSIKFIDEEWTGSSFYSPTGEGENTWTNNTGNYISKGTVVIVENANHQPTVNIGSISETDAGFDIASSSPDQIFAIAGTRAAPKFLTMMGHTTLPNNGTGAQQTLNGTGLSIDTTCIHLTAEHLYVGNTTCDTIANCLTKLHDDANWQSISTNLKFPDDVPSNFTGNALPVSLSAFYLVEESFGLRLVWQTAQEFNNYGFVIQSRHSDGVWTDIDFIHGQGNSFVPFTYSFALDIPDQETTLYRLKQIDFDGGFAYSDVIRFTNNKIQPAHAVWRWSGSKLVIESDDSEIDNVKIFNHVGINVYHENPHRTSIEIPAYALQACFPYAYVALRIEGREQILTIPVESK